MAKQTTFKVSKKGFEAIEVTFLVPESPSDPRWQELGVADENAVNDLATQTLIIRVQGALRGHLEEGAAAVQKVADEFKMGVRGTGTRKSRAKVSADQVKEAKFSAKQIELLKAAGVVFEEEPAEAAA